MNRWWLAFQNTRNGFWWGWENEKALREELIALALSFPLCFLVTDNDFLRLALVGSLILLLIVELLNTAIEKLCDHVTPVRSEEIRVIKDLGSAAVFSATVIVLGLWLYALVTTLI